jgi:cytoskeletal protein RodZ
VGSQLSRPYQIALIAAVAIVLVWFFVLRPKSNPSTSPSSPAPAATPAPAQSKPQTSVGRAVQHARGSAAASDASTRRREAAAAQATSDAPAQHATKPGTAAAAPAQPAARPAPAQAAPPPTAPTPDARRPTPDAPASDAPRVLVLLFWNRGATDDRAVRATLSHVNRHHGQVAIAAAPIQDVGRYRAITASVHVLESPTVIVLDTRTRQARTITGYTDVGELDQAVAESLAAPGSAG